MKRWEEEIDSITQEVQGAFDQLSPEALHWKPAPDRWSIAQNLEHLILINQSYEPIVRRLRAGNLRLPWYARVGFVPQVFGRLLLKAVQPENRQKTKTFRIWEPAQDAVATGVLERFSRHQQELKAWMDVHQDLVAKGSLIYSPASRYLVYPLDTAFSIIIAHERRHAQQAKAVLSQLPAALQ